MARKVPVKLVVRADVAMFDASASKEKFKGFEKNAIWARKRRLESAIPMRARALRAANNAETHKHRTPDIKICGKKSRFLGALPGRLYCN